MPSVSLPCPSCSTALILDEENAGQEVFCPDCNAHLRLPSQISAGLVPEILNPPSAPAKSSPAKGRKKNPPAKPTEEASAQTRPPADSAPKSALPQGRTKSTEEEIKRLAAAAAAAGAAHSFQPEAASLPADHHRTVLPTKRALPPEPSGAPVAPPVPAEMRPAKILPNRRVTGAPLDPSPIIRTIEPIEPPPEIEISATPLRGPSRFVGAAPPAAVPPEPRPDVAPETDEASGEDAIAKRGFRLGAERNLHFSPVHTPELESDARDWGSATHTPEEAARSRRFVSLALLIVLLAAGGVGLYVLRHAFQAPGAATTSAESISQEEAKAEEDVMRNVEDARRVMQRFLEADSLEKMAAEVRHPELSRPRMERYYAANPLKPRKKRSESQSWSEIRIAETEFIRAALELDDFRVYPIALEIFPGADPKVDWESFVNWSELPWKDFLKTPPEQSVDFRVTVTHEPDDQYYNYSFKGRELDLMCFKIEDPERYGSCWAYCDKDSETASQLLFHLKSARRQKQVNQDGKSAISCILRLRFPPEGRKTNQVMIEKFIHDNWVQP